MEQQHDIGLLANEIEKDLRALELEDEKEDNQKAEKRKQVCNAALENFITSRGRLAVSEKIRFENPFYLR